MNFNLFTVEQSQSSSSRQRTKSESFVYSKVIRRSSQKFSSIENLENLITCSIHLGLIKEPRQLPCGHAFCYSCLKNYLETSSKSECPFLICPLCRHETSINLCTLNKMAPSLVHKQLAEYLIIKRQKVLDSSLEYGQSELAQDKNINEIKLELMRHLLTDFEKEISTDTESDLEKQFNSILNEHSTTVMPQYLRIRSVSESGYRPPMRVIRSTKSDVYEHLDRNSITKNMRKYREYKLIKALTHPKQSEIRQVSWIDQKTSSGVVGNSEVMIYIVNDSSLIYFSNIEGTKLRNFTLNIEGISLSPFFVKCHDRVLFVVGCFYHESVLMKVDMAGIVLQYSVRYVGSLGGFCVDDSDNTVIVAYPTKHSVLILDKNSLDELKKFCFGDLSPMYVAKSSNCHEIWVSCPDDGRIAVYDEVQDNYLHLDTSQIYESMPTHINETKDHRILFLDSSGSRIFWIRRWNNHLYIQLLIVFGVNEEMQLKSLEPMSENMIMLSNNKWTYIAKPSRSVKEEQQKQKCVLL